MKAKSHRQAISQIVVTTLSAVWFEIPMSVSREYDDSGGCCWRLLLVWSWNLIVLTCSVDFCESAMTIARRLIIDL